MWKEQRRIEEEKRGGEEEETTSACGRCKLRCGGREEEEKHGEMGRDAKRERGGWEKE